MKHKTVALFERLTIAFCIFILGLILGYTWSSYHTYTDNLIKEKKARMELSHTEFMAALPEPLLTPIKYPVIKDYVNRYEE